jgi:hypothetical protein
LCDWEGAGDVLGGMEEEEVFAVELGFVDELLGVLLIFTFLCLTATGSRDRFGFVDKKCASPFTFGNKLFCWIIGKEE